MNSELESNLHQFTGSENYYRYLFGLVYTDGIKYLAEHANAYWLITLIASHQGSIKRMKDDRLQQLQFWTLTVNQNKTAVATCVADSGEPPAVKQEIPFTDFCLDEITIWVVEGELGMVAMLPSEY